MKQNLKKYLEEYIVDAQKLQKVNSNILHEAIKLNLQNGICYYVYKKALYASYSKSYYFDMINLFIVYLRVYYPAFIVNTFVDICIVLDEERGLNALSHRIKIAKFIISHINKES